MQSSPIVAEIFICASQGEPLVAQEHVEAVTDMGLVGDRYYLGTGFYSGDKVWDANVTLIEQEAYDAASKGLGSPIETSCLRRNLVTQGVELSKLIGRDFSIGTAILRGTKLWPPCSYVNAMHPDKEILTRFARSAGIGATVIQGGKISRGDAITVLNVSMP